MLNRRNFLLYSLAGTGGLLMSFNYISKITNMQQVISDILLENIQGLKIERSDVQKYAQDMIENNALNMSFASTQLLCVYQMRGAETLLFPFNRKYHQLCTDMTAQFLLSTDFFINKMDEERQIKYSGTIYSIYKRACANPFSGLYYK